MVPCPGFDASVTSPPWARAIRRASARPRPTPPVLRVAAAVGAPERRARALELVGGHADAAVDDLERDRVAVRGGPRAIDRSRLGVLRGVVEQVVERAAQQHRIAVDRRVGARRARRSSATAGVARARTGRPARSASSPTGRRRVTRDRAGRIGIEPRGR